MAVKAQIKVKKAGIQQDNTTGIGQDDEPGITKNIKIDKKQDNKVNTTRDDNRMGE